MTTDPVDNGVDPNGDLSEDPSGDSVLTGHVALWWQAVNDFTTLLETGAGRAVVEPDRPARLGRARGGRPRRAPRVAAGRRPAGRRRRSASPARPRDDGPVHRAGRRRPPGRVPGRPHQRDPRRRPPPGTRPCWPTRRPTPRRPRPALFGGIGWSTWTLLRNRPLDVWMHEQDVRRARRPARRPRRRAAAHTADYLTESLGYVRGQAGRRRRPAPRWCSRSTGHAPVARRPSARTDAAGWSRGARRADGSAAHWTARPSSCWPAAGAARAGRVRSTATRAGPPGPRRRWR